MVRKGYHKRYYKKKYLLQINERILLFLDDHVGMYDQAELPVSLTQTGIANALEIRRSQVSQVMSALMEEGLVSGELRHVQGGRRRRLCYYLTPRGMDRAREIENMVGNEPIELAGVDGAKREVRLREIPGILADGSTILDVVTHARRSKFSVADYKRTMTRKRRPVASRLPKLRRFFGRRKELKTVRSFLESKEKRILTIRGIAGIGKSTLAAKVMKEMKGQTNLFYYQLKDWTTVRSLLMSFSKVLSELDRNDLRFYLESNKQIDLDEVGLIMEECLRGLDGLIVIDDCQSANDEVLEFLKSFKGFLGGSNEFKAIILGRQIPSFYDRRDVSVRNIVAEMELGGLSDEGCRELLSSRKLPGSEFDRIIEKTEGHPLFLELIDSSAPIVSGDLKRFLTEEISSKLTREEDEVLTTASTYRHPVNLSAFFVDEKIDLGIVDSLVSQSLLTVDSEEKYAVHDTIREFFFDRLPESKKAVHHRNAGSYYSNFSDPVSVLEAQHHLIRGGAFDSASELISLHGESLIQEGYSEDLLERIEEIHDPEEMSLFRVEVLLLKGQVLSLLGRWKEALASLEEAKAASIEEGDADLQLQAIAGIGEITRKHGKVQEAHDLLKDAMSEMSDETDRSVAARILSNFALVQASQVDYDGAFETLDALDRRTSEFPNEPERADFLATKGAVLSFSGLYEKAHESRERAVRINEQNHDVLRLVNAYNGLGTSLYRLEKDDLALEYFERAAKFAQKTGDVRSQGFILFNTASVYIKRKNLQKARENLDSAGVIFRHLEDKKMTADIDLSLAFVEYEKGEPERAASYLERHLTQIAKLGAPMDIVESNKSAGELYSEMGYVNEALVCFESALSHSDDPGQSEGLRELIQGLRGRGSSP